LKIKFTYQETFTMRTTLARSLAIILAGFLLSSAAGESAAQTTDQPPVKVKARMGVKKPASTEIDTADSVVKSGENAVMTPAPVPVGEPPKQPEQEPAKQEPPRIEAPPPESPAQASEPPQKGSEPAVGPKMPAGQPLKPGQKPPFPVKGVPPPAKKGEKPVLIEVSAHSDCTKNRQRGPFKLDFQKADILDIVKFISELTCKNFIIPDNLRQGKITIMSPLSVTVDEAYQAFLSALEVNKLTIVPSGRYLKLMGQRDSISATIPFYMEDGKFPVDDRMITKLIKLDYVDANTLTPTLKQLASKDGDIFTYAPTNTIIISDTGNNLFRLEQIIKQLDVPGSEEEIQLVQVNFATASQLAEKLTSIYDIKQGQKPAVTTVPPKVASAKGAESKGDERGEIRISKITADDRTNKLIVVGSPKSFKEILELIRKLDVPISGEGQVHVYYLDNADAEQLASTLGHLSQGAKSGGAAKAPPGAKGGSAQSAELFSGEVKVTADKSTNSLVIIASAGDYKNIVNVIRRLDVRRRQVFIESVIMEVTLTDTMDLGIAVSGGTALSANGTKFPLFGGTMLGGLNSVSTDLASLASMGGLISGVQGPPIDGVTLGSAKISIPSFGVVLRALQQNSNVNTLSTPNLLTTDNEDAEILVGQNIPYQSGFTSAVGGTSVNSFNPIVSIQRMDVALKLKVKPQINNSDYVKLNVEEEVSEVTAQDQLLGPTTSKRSAKTVIIARDQQTVAIGGLIKDNTTQTTYKVPFFGDIPVLGWLFRNKHSQVTKTNLIMFLTPYIIKDRDDFRKIFERKMKERQDFIQAFYGSSKLDYTVYVDYTKKRSPFSEINHIIDTEMLKAENEGPGIQGETVITPEGVVEPPAGKEQNPLVPGKQPEQRAVPPATLSPEQPGQPQAAPEPPPSEPRGMAPVIKPVVPAPENPVPKPPVSPEDRMDVQ
jgi:general secretion pathway protein D